MDVRKKIGIISAAVMSLATMGIGAEGASPSVQIVKEAVPLKIKEQVKLVPVRKQSVLSVSYRYKMTPKKNQRQKRKYWRQNPHKRPK